MARIARLAIPIGSAVLLALAYFNPFLWWAVFFALTPLFIELRSRRGWKAVGTGYIFGAVFMTFQFSFLLNLVNRWTGNPYIGWVPVILAALISGWWFGLAGWLISRAWESHRSYLIPLIWVGVEILRSQTPVVAFPWAMLGQPLAPYPALIQHAWIGTVYLVSAWAVLPNLLLAQMITGGKRIAFILEASAFSIILMLSALRLLLPIQGNPVTLTAGQPGVDLDFTARPDGTNDPEMESLHNFRIEAILSDAKNRGTALVVLPEGANLSHKGLPDVSFRIDPTQAVVFGTWIRGSGGDQQSIALLDNGLSSSYSKMRLVIFGEFVPLRNVFPGLAAAFRLPQRDALTGTEMKSLVGRRITVAPLICFEGLFPDMAYLQGRSRSDVLAIASNDTWFGGTFAVQMLRSASVFRAVETNMPTARAAQTGVTMLIDQRGQVLKEAPLAEMATATGQVKVGHGGSFVLAPIFPISCLLTCVIVGFPKRKPQAKSPSPQPEASAP